MANYEKSSGCIPHPCIFVSHGSLCITFTKMLVNKKHSSNCGTKGWHKNKRRQDKAVK